MADLVALQEIIGVTFKDLSLLEQALIHRSYLNENPDFALPSNERLEFLGDAVLGFLVAERLYHEFANLSEGEMTKIRAALVCKETLACLATSIGLGDHLYLGWGEEASGGRTRQTNLSRALEALIGAIFLDQGTAGARGFVLRLLGSELQRVIAEKTTTDYKSQLQELIQDRQHLTPTYRIIEAVGPSHDKRFAVEVLVGDKVMGKGSGKSKRMAEMEAARSALESLPGPWVGKEPLY